MGKIIFPGKCLYLSNKQSERTRIFCSSSLEKNRAILSLSVTRNFVRMDLDENNPAITVPEPAQYVSTKYGGQLLIDSFNFTYFKNAKTAKAIYWECSRKSGCPARATTDGEGVMIKRTTPHNHGSDPIDLKKRKLEEKVKQTIKMNPKSSTDSVLTIWKKDTLSPEQRSVAIKEKSMQRKIQRARAKELSHPAKPTCFGDLEIIPEKFTVTCDGNKFLLANEMLDSGERILIFSSPFGLGMLSKVARISMHLNLMVNKSKTCKMLPLFLGIHVVWGWDIQCLPGAVHAALHLAG